MKTILNHVWSEFTTNNVQLQWNHWMHFPINRQICTMCLQFEWFHVGAHTDFHIFRLHFLFYVPFFFSSFFGLFVAFYSVYSLFCSHTKNSNSSISHLYISCLNTIIKHIAVLIGCRQLWAYIFEHTTDTDEKKDTIRFENTNNKERKFNVFAEHI